MAKRKTTIKRLTKAEWDAQFIKSKPKGKTTIKRLTKAQWDAQFGVTSKPKKAAKRAKKPAGMKGKK